MLHQQNVAPRDLRRYVHAIEIDRTDFRRRVLQVTNETAQQYAPLEFCQCNDLLRYFIRTDNANMSYLQRIIFSL